MALMCLVCVKKRWCLFHMKILHGIFLYCQTKRLTALPKSMAAVMDHVKSPWRNWMLVSHTDALFTSPTPVINVVTVKFIKISCTPDLANIGPSKLHQLLRSKQSKGRGKTSAKMPPKHFAKAPASNVKQHDEDNTSGTPHCANSMTAHRVC